MKNLECTLDYWIIRTGMRFRWLVSHSKLLTLIFLWACRDYWPEFLGELGEYRKHRNETRLIRCRGASSVKSQQARK